MEDQQKHFDLDLETQHAGSERLKLAGRGGLGGIEKKFLNCLWPSSQYQEDVRRECYARVTLCRNAIFYSLPDVLTEYVGRHIYRFALP